MSYGVAAALQTAIYDRLSRDATLNGLVGGAIYDGVPSGSLPSLYVSLGEEIVTDRSDGSGGGALHDFTVAVISDANGFADAKAAAAAVSDALLGPVPDTGRGYVVGLWFRRADARRVRKSGVRRIDLRFRAQVQDDNL